jgi:hypothetical protein
MKHLQTRWQFLLTDARGNVVGHGSVVATDRFEAVKSVRHSIVSIPEPTKLGAELLVHVEEPTPPPTAGTADPESKS